MGHVDRLHHLRWLLFSPYGRHFIFVLGYNLRNLQQWGFLYLLFHNASGWRQDAVHLRVVVSLGGRLVVSFRLLRLLDLLDAVNARIRSVPCHLHPLCDASF